MRKYIYNVIIILFVLQMSHVHVNANYEQENIATANSIETLQYQIQKEVMQLTTEFEIRYTGEILTLKDELTELIKNAVTDPYIYANISSYKWSYSGYANNIVIQFQFTYHISQEEEAFVNRTLTNIIAPMHGLSELQKIQAAHDFIVLSSEYSKQTIGSQYSPYTLLTENKGVCQAYALVLYRMLEKLGFDVQYVTGEVGEELHAWVLVKLDGEWYHIDVTWNDPLPDRKGEVRYSYFMLSDKQLAKDHTWDFANYPAATSERFTSMQEETTMYSIKKQAPERSLNTRLGLFTLGENKLFIKQQIERPTYYKNSHLLSNVLYDNSKQVVNTQLICEIPFFNFSITENIYESTGDYQLFTSITKTKKRMPQEKLVIIKEVPQISLGAPPSSC